MQAKHECIYKNKFHIKKILEMVKEGKQVNNKGKLIISTPKLPRRVKQEPMHVSP